MTVKLSDILLILLFILVLVFIFYNVPLPDKDCLETFAEDYCEAKELIFVSISRFDKVFYCSENLRLPNIKYKFLDTEWEACRK